jgi:hypothetical protein
MKKLLLALLALPIPALFAQTLSNGDFETTPLANGTNGVGAIPNWTSYGDVIYAGGSGIVGATTSGTATGRTGINGADNAKTTFSGTIVPGDGTAAFINPNNTGESGISTTVSGLTVGKWYSVNFQGANDNTRTGITGVISVTDGAAEQYVWSQRPAATGQTTMGSAKQSQVFKATDTSMTLRLGANAGTNNAFLYDSISVSEVTASNTGKGRGVGNLLADGYFEQYQNFNTTNGVGGIIAGASTTFAVPNSWTLTSGASGNTSGIGRLMGSGSNIFNNSNTTVRNVDGFQVGAIQQGAEIYQDITLTAGLYDLYWSDASRSGNGTNYSIMWGLASGSLSSLQNVLGSSVSATGWTDRGFQINVTTDGTYRLMFDGTGSTDTTTYFDNVSLVAIPEPGTLMLVGIALGSLLLFRRRK